MNGLAESSATLGLGGKQIPHSQTNNFPLHILYWSRGRKQSGPVTVPLEPVSGLVLVPHVENRPVPEW